MGHCFAMVTVVPFHVFQENLHPRTNFEKITQPTKRDVYLNHNLYIKSLTDGV